MTAKSKGMATQLTRTRRPRSGSVVTAMRTQAAASEGGAVAVADIQPNPDNPEARSRPSEAMVQSVREVGVIQDLVLVPVDLWLAAHPDRDGDVTSAPYVALAGHKRLAAAVAADLDEVPARIRGDLNATTLDSMVLHENLHRQALTAVEEAEAYRRLMDNRGLSQRALAKHVGVSQSQISKKLKLLDLPPGLLAVVSDGLVGIEESAIVLDESPEVVEVIDQAVALVSEGDVVDLGRVIEESRVFVRAQQARATARQQADERKAPFVEDADLRQALSLSGNEDRGARRLLDDKDIAAAQGSGNLVVSVSPTSTWGGGGKVEFYTTKKPEKEPSTPDPIRSEQGREDYQRQKANKARRAALIEIVKTPPRTDAIRRELLAWAIAGGGWGSEVCRIAQPLLEGAGLIAKGLNYWEVRRDLPSLSERQQYHATWILMVAHNDEEVGLPLHHGPWGQRHVDHYEWLAKQGYEPGEWEQEKLTATHKTLDDAQAQDNEGEVAHNE